MSPRHLLRGVTVTAVITILAALLATPVSAAPSAKGGAGRYRLQRVSIEDPAGAPNLSKPGALSGARVRLPAAAAAKAAGINPDPAFDYKGLLWDYGRIGLPQGWKTSAGSSAVTVGVADTGLDFTHAELAPKVKQVVDLTTLEDPPLCKSLFGISDQDLAAQFGGPAETDWYGHGSWIGGNIAAALDGKGVNGIAPKVNLVSLKIAHWCGFSYSTTEIASFIKAADLGVDVVNISFGGYADRSNPDDELLYQAYIDAVAYARSKGTIIVAAAGNEHLRIGAGGKVISHGPLTTPGTDPADFQDYFGLYEVPGGIPGVVDVSSTGRVVNPSSASCPPGTVGDSGDPDADPPVAPNFEATCKPASDPHQAAGPGQAEPARLLLELRPPDRHRRPGWGAQVQPAQLRPGRHRGLPLGHRRPDQRLGGLQHHLQLGDPDPVLLPERGGRVPRRPGLLDHPGHLDGRSARGRLPGPGRQRPPVAAQAPGGAAEPPAGPRQHRRPQPHTSPLGHRHLARRPDRTSLHHRLLPPGGPQGLRQRRLWSRPGQRGQPIAVLA
jgi:Subtilase family